MTECYRAYGLTLQSNIAIPGLRSCANISEADVLLELRVENNLAPLVMQPGEVVHRSEPADPETADPAFLLTSIDAGAFFRLLYSDGTQFVVDRAAKRVRGTCPPPLTIEDLATYLLGPVMGFVLRRRGVTCLHASAVCIGGQAVVLCGAAGAGKSTTAAALALRGAPVLGEDISSLCENRSGFHVQPGYPRVCLWPDAVEKLLDLPEALPRLTPNWEKCYLALDGKRAKFEEQQKPLGAIYLFGDRVQEEHAPRIEEIAPSQGLLQLVQNTYMNSLLDREQRAHEFDVLSRMASQVPLRRIVPHRDSERIDALCAMILSDAWNVVRKRKPAALAPER